jgi:hypothetical protein
MGCEARFHDLIIKLKLQQHGNNQRPPRVRTAFYAVVAADACFVGHKPIKVQLLLLSSDLLFAKKQTYYYVLIIVMLKCQHHSLSVGPAAIHSNSY